VSTIIVEPQTKLITGEELLALGDIGPCELIDGRIVPMSPTSKEHGSLESRLDRSLGGFVEAHGLGEAFVGEVGIYIRRGPDRIRAADFAFVSNERLRQSTGQGFLGVAPELVVEIVSATDRWSEIRQKLGDYFSIRVERVWIVEPENRDVLVYRSSTEAQAVREGDTLRGEGALEGFSLAVSDLFAE
jgi:Uma2 family endonuclease